MDKSKFKNKKEWRKFGYGLTIILSLIATIQLIIGNDAYPYLFFLAGAVLLIGLVLPVLLKPIFVLFSYLGYSLGWVMTRVILTILFYLVFTSIGAIARLLGNQFLDLKINKKAKSYWVDREQEESANNYVTQF